MDLQLVNLTLECNEIISSKKLNTSTGLYSSFICKPSPFNPDGTPKACMCGHTYVEGSTHIKKGTLYTRLGPVEVEYHETLCSAGECKLPFTLFKNTTFWHDLFHFIGHLCGVNFKSGRVLGLEGVNTEICEQVNSFLQVHRGTSFTGPLYILSPIFPVFDEQR